MQPLWKSLQVLIRIRMADWMIAATLLWLLVFLIQPAQLALSIYKLALVALAALAGFWIDRSLFSYARPETFFSLSRDTSPPGQRPPETAFTHLAEAISFAEGQTISELQAASCADLLALARVAMLRRAAIVAAAIVGVSLGA